MKELQKTAEEFIDFLDTYIEDRSTPITALYQKIGAILNDKNQES